MNDLGAEVRPDGAALGPGLEDPQCGLAEIEILPHGRVDEGVEDGVPEGRPPIGEFLAFVADRRIVGLSPGRPETNGGPGAVVGPHLAPGGQRQEQGHERHRGAVIHRLGNAPLVSYSSRRHARPEGSATLLPGLPELAERPG